MKKVGLFCRRLWGSFGNSATGIFVGATAASIPEVNIKVGSIVATNSTIGVIGSFQTAFGMFVVGNNSIINFTFESINVSSSTSATCISNEGKMTINGGLMTATATDSASGISSGFSSVTLAALTNGQVGRIVTTSTGSSIGVSVGGGSRTSLDIESISATTTSGSLLSIGVQISSGASLTPSTGTANVGNISNAKIGFSVSSSGGPKHGTFRFDRIESSVGQIAVVSAINSFITLTGRYVENSFIQTVGAEAGGNGLIDYESTVSGVAGFFNVNIDEVAFVGTVEDVGRVPVFNLLGSVLPSASVFHRLKAHVKDIYVKEPLTAAGIYRSDPAVLYTSSTAIAFDLTTDYVNLPGGNNTSTDPGLESNYVYRIDDLPVSSGAGPTGVDPFGVFNGLIKVIRVTSAQDAIILLKSIERLYILGNFIQNNNTNTGGAIRIITVATSTIYADDLVVVASASNSVFSDNANTDMYTYRIPVFNVTSSGVTFPFAATFPPFVDSSVI